MRGVFLDTETNGLNWTKHHILEISCKIFDLNTGELLEAHTSFIQMDKETWALGNEESLRFNGITWDQVKSAPSPEIIKTEILTLFKANNIRRGNAVFICQNPSFDRIFFSILIDVDIQERFKFPYIWLDLASMFWSKQISNGENPNTIQLSKDKIANFFKLPPEKKPHRAENGVDHLIVCYKKVVGFPKKTKSNT